MATMVSHLRPGLVLLAIFTLCLGGLYPAVVTGLVERGFHTQLDDSVIRDRSGRVVATSFATVVEDQPDYFWGRIQVAGQVDCDAGPAQPSPACAQALAQRTIRLRAGGAVDGKVPGDLVSFATSNRGAQISVAAAYFQVDRIARARHVGDAQIVNVIDDATHNAIYNTTKGLYVDVTELNVRLDGKLS